MESLLFEKKYGVKIRDLKTIDDINKVFEKNEGKKVTYDRGGGNSGGDCK